MLSFETFCSSIALKNYFCLHFKYEIYEKQQCLKKKSLCTFLTNWARGNSPFLNLFLPLILRNTMNENMSFHLNISKRVKDCFITTGELLNLRKVQFTLPFISLTYNQIIIMAKTTFWKWNSFEKVLACAGFCLNLFSFPPYLAAELRIE